MRPAEPIDIAKYTQIRTDLLDDDSEQDMETEEMFKLMGELIPAYYKYRGYLFNILKETNANPRTIIQCSYPEGHMQERLRKCQDYKDSFERNDVSSREMRAIVTEEIIFKHRKRLQQERNLAKKYEQNQMNEVIHEEEPQIHINEIHQEGRAYNPLPSQRSHREGKRSSVEAKVAHTGQFANLNPQEGNQQASQPWQLQLKSRKNSQHLRARSNGNQNLEENQNESVASEKPALNTGRPQINIVDADSYYQVEESEAKLKPRKKSLGQRNYTDAQIIVPPIKIRNKHSKEYVTDRTSQLVSPRSNLNNLVIHHEDTFSEHHNLQPASKRNIGAFYDTFSQKVGGNKFFQAQSQKLTDQKRKAAELHNEVNYVLGEPTNPAFKTLNDAMSSKPSLITANWQEEEQQNGQSFTFTFRHLLGEVCDLYIRAQCVKFSLKNKQFQILKYLSSQELGSGPIYAKNMLRNVQSLIKTQQKADANIIIANIFGEQPCISFDLFGESFKTELTKQQHSYLGSKNHKSIHHNTEQMLKRLFSLWLEISYFETKIRKGVQGNARQIQQLRKRLTQDGTHLLKGELQKFIYTSSQNRVNRIKIELFFRKVCPSNQFTQLMVWLKIKAK